jgi:hypothetical protein
LIVHLGPGRGTVDDDASEQNHEQYVESVLLLLYRVVLVADCRFGGARHADLSSIDRRYDVLLVRLRPIGRLPHVLSHLFIGGPRDLQFFKLGECSKHSKDVMMKREGGEAAHSER